MPLPLLPRRVSFAIWGAAALLCAATLGAAAVLISYDERAAMKESEGKAQRFVAGAEASLNRTLIGVDLLLADMAEVLMPAANDSALDAAAAAHALRSQTNRNMLLRDIALVDSEGTVLAAARPDTARLGLPLSHDFIHDAAMQVASSMRISGPLLNFSSSERALYFARPVSLPGNHRMLVVAEVPLPLIGSILSQSAEIPGLSVSLEREDGELLASLPAIDARLGSRLHMPIDANWTDGLAHRLPGRLDEQPSIVVARPTLYRSVLVAASISTEAALAQWRDERQVVLITAVSFVLMILLAAWAAHWQVLKLARARRELVQATQTVDQALASMNEGFMLCDAADRVVTWNQRYVDIAPWLRGELTQGMPFERIVEISMTAVLPNAQAQQRRAWCDMRMSVHRGGTGMFDQQLPDGRMIHVVERRTPDGGVVSLFSDVTAIERDLSRALAAAEAATLAKAQLIASLSREIRTPLNGVLGMNRLLLRTPLTEAQRDYARTIQASGMAMLALINDTVDMTKVETGRMALDVAAFDPAVLLNEVMATMAVRAHEKQLVLGSEMAADLPKLLLGDAGRLRQVLFNLIGNALKFTELGSVQVQLGFHGLSEGAGSPNERVELTIAVRDTGVGIAAERIPQLFGRFVPASSRTARRHEGSGLGLAISREIIDLMGGRISVETDLGVGSTFRVWVPLVRGTARVEAADGASHAPAEAAHGLRVLVAEDNEVNQVVVRALLEQMGHTSEIVGNGAEVVRRVQEGSYDVVLMDIQMPDMDGETATREIRALEGAAASIPIIALTANAMVADRDSYLAAGMDDYVAKPINVRQLAAAISRVMARGMAPGIATTARA